MIVPASGHQVRCIPWVQMGTFNKEIGFLCGLKCVALNIFCREYLQSSLHLMLQIWWKPWYASKHTDLLNSCLGKWYLIPYLVVPLISARVPLISTRVSVHCQAILLWYHNDRLFPHGFYGRYLSTMMLRVCKRHVCANFFRICGAVKCLARAMRTAWTRAA